MTHGLLVERDSGLAIFMLNYLAANFTRMIINHWMKRSVNDFTFRQDKLR